MTLSELGAYFLKFKEPSPEGGNIYERVPELSNASGVVFLCPKCYAANSGPIGTHSVICWFTGRVPDGEPPMPGRWNPSGSGLSDLTFVPPGAVSVQLLGGCNWHGFVANGEAS